MSILIKGMDMPKLGENAERLWVPSWIEVGKDGKAIFCTGTHFDPNTIRSYPIGEIPTPHGRLIDADEFFDKAKEYLSNSRNDFYRVAILQIFKDILNSTETIIEAEGKNEPTN